ncbi:hypothetical protein HPB48_008285 [Haemaphysalis longicornis]|uniref:HAT C-terminal dimerisation domain-containing protein n=1 Tax=Haemaphysalis longicornis TaxID=44386 RepID=A0A9J6GRU2_HAELO|nr:hypothetical protein HPB48_008285 [Haemaphysalis longicornis]
MSAVIETFGAWDKGIFPTNHTLLQVMVTLPTNVATAETDFSTLRSLKTCTQFSMYEDRLFELALVPTHRDTFIDVNSVIEPFARGGNRRSLLSQ